MQKFVPPIDELQGAATAIRADSEYQSIRTRLQSFLRHYEPINYNLWYGAPLWLVRKCTDSKGFRRIDEVHYPPPGKVSAGRINEPGAPVLYLSFNKFIAFHEVDARDGDHLHLVGYSMSRNRPIRSLIIGEINNVHKRGRATIPGGLEESLNAILNRMSPAVGASFVFMDAFLSAMLADRDAVNRQYIHSRALSSLLFERYPDIHAIHYPSVALEGSMNLAVKPPDADVSLRVCGTSVIRIKKRYDYGICDFEVVRNASAWPAHNDIVWH